MYNSIVECPKISNLGVLSKHYKKMGGILQASTIYILPSCVGYILLVCFLSFASISAHSLKDTLEYPQDDYREKGGREKHFSGSQVLS